ncbi:hypothetical protein ACSBR1_020658 [Camellia fascicularis]
MAIEKLFKDEATEEKGTPHSERICEEITISNTGPSKICEKLDSNCCIIPG